MKQEEEDGIVKNSKSNLVKKTAKKFAKTGKEAVQTGFDKSKQIKEKIETTASDVISEMDEKAKNVKDGIQHELTKAAVSTAQFSKSTKPGSGKLGGMDKRIEDQIFSWYGWMWSIIAFTFIILISFVISSNDDRFSLLPIILLICFPIYIMWIIYNAIPEIKFGNKVVFSRKDVSLQKQLTFGKAIAKTFSREMIKNSPEGAILIGFFLVLLLYVLLAPIL